MADQRLTDKTELTEIPNENDVLHIVDVSDTSADASGTSKQIKYSNLVNNELSVQNEITTNTTFSGTKKGLNNLYPINNTSDLQMTIDKGTYSIGDVVNFKRRGLGGLEIVRGTDVRLEGKRNIDNQFKIANKGNLASVIFDKLDGSILVGSVVGDIQSGYSGVVTTSSYSELKEGDTAKNVTVIGTGFSANMIISVSANATLNSWNFVNNNQITLNLDAVGVEANTVTVTYDNGDVFIDTDAITIAAATPSIILFEDDFTGTSLDTAKWDLSNPDSADLIISQNDKLLFTRVTDLQVTNSLNNNITSDNSYLKGGALSVLCNREVGYNISNTVIRWDFNGTSDQIRINTENDDFLLIIRQGGTTVYNVSSGVTTDKRIKVTYDNSNDIKFWYWGGASWVQMGTTQNYNLGAVGFVSLSSGSNAGDAINDVFSFDDVRVTNADYTTELPS